MHFLFDGHHRYLASLIANYQLTRVQSKRTSATKIIDWKSVIFVDDDWDTEADIQRWNQEDAKFNELPLESVLKALG